MTIVSIPARAPYAASAAPALPLVGMAIRSIPNCFAMVTAIASPRALNDPVGSRPSSFTSRLWLLHERPCSATATIGVSGSPRLTGFARRAAAARAISTCPARGWRCSPGSASASQRRDRSEPSSGLPALLRLWTPPGFVALAGQRAFEMSDVHCLAILVIGQDGGVRPGSCNVRCGTAREAASARSEADRRIAGAAA